MKGKYWIVLFLLISLVCQGQSNRLLIQQSGKVGYINKQGKIMIPAIYANAMNFSEGLAAVREHGYFGFIDTNGNYVIPPTYEYAWSFSHGLARVGDAKNIRYINKRNVLILDHINGTLQFFGTQKAMYRTNNRHEGVIDVTSGQLIIDTIFETSLGMEQFEFGVTKVKVITKSNDENERIKEGLIDTNGKMVVPFGKYSTIGDFSDGYAVVTIPDSSVKKGTIDGVIDFKGNLLFAKKFERNQFLRENFHEGLARISLTKNSPTGDKDDGWNSEKTYEGYINLNGNIVMDDTNVRDAMDFSCNRAVVRDRERNDYLINTAMKKVGGRFIHIGNFEDGYAIASNEDGTGVIDTDARFVIPISNIGTGDIVRVGKYFAIKEATNNDDNKLYGLKNPKNKTILPAITNGILGVDEDEGIITALVGSKVDYFDFSGKRVWEMDLDNKNLIVNADFDYMLSGNYYMFEQKSRNVIGEGIGHKILNGISDNRLAVFIDTSSKDTLRNKYSFWGYNAYVVNNSRDTIRFYEQDHTLYMNAQAMNENGEWKDIEYLTYCRCSSCPNTMLMCPGKYCLLPMPKYTGVFQTKIRLKLFNFTYGTNEAAKLHVIYSNVIEGSVNPAQFWNKRDYHPLGLMDPYDE